MKKLIKTLTLTAAGLVVGAVVLKRVQHNSMINEYYLNSNQVTRALSQDSGYSPLRLKKRLDGMYR